MIDFLLAIYADRNTCKPYTGPGRVGHVVRVTDMAHPTIINEFVDGGSFEHSDCAPASLQSWLIDRPGVTTSIKELEQLAGTNANGTGWKGIEIAGLHFGYEIKFSTDNPPLGLYIMNPGGGYIDPPSELPAYLAATQGGCLVLPNVAPIPTPIPPTPVHPISTEEEEMPKIVTSVRPAGSGADPNGDGSVYLVANWPYGPKRHITAAAWAAVGSYLLQQCGQTAPEDVNPYALDRIEDGPSYTADYVNTSAEPTSTTPIPAPE